MPAARIRGSQNSEYIRLDKNQIMTIQLYENFETITPGCCSITFAVPVNVYNRWLKTKQGWFCPACGSSRVFTGQTEEQKLKKVVEQQQAQLQQTRNTLSNVTRNYTKMRKRVASGVCPCCTRTFQNLLNHMKNQHPDFGSNKTLRLLRETYGLSQIDLSRDIGVNAQYVSMYENQKPVPAASAQLIEEWIETQGAA